MLIDKVIIGEIQEDGTLVPMEIQIPDIFKEKNNFYERQVKKYGRIS